MNAFMKQLSIQFRMNFRDSNVLLIFYIVPLLFYAVMGAVFSSINPELKQTLASTMVLYAITMGAVLGIPPLLVKMRETGVLRAYRTSGIPGFSVLLSIAISSFLHLAIVSAIISLSAPLLFGADVPGNPAGFTLVLLLVLICSIALGLLIGVTAKSQAIAMMLSQLIFLPSLLLGGIMFPSSLLPRPLMMLGRVFPATYGMQAFQEMAYELKPEIGMQISLPVLALISLAAMLITIGRFSRITRVS